MNKVNVKTRQARGNGGIRFRNGKYEGIYRLHTYDDRVITKSFTRDTIEEICEIKAKLKLLGTLDSDVVDIHIDKYNNNNITLKLCIKKY